MLQTIIFIIYFQFVLISHFIKKMKILLHLWTVIIISHIEQKKVWQNEIHEDIIRRPFA